MRTGPKPGPPSKTSNGHTGKTASPGCLLQASHPEGKTQADFYG